MKTKLFLAFCLLCSMTVHAKVNLPDLISHNMVLQQQTNARFWGEATPNSTVTIQTSWNTFTETKADTQGFWETTVSTPSASFTPQTITISDGEPTTLHNVLIGEVWLCSGQSNMEMPLKGFARCPIEDANDVIADAPNHTIRIATIQRKGALTPQTYAKSEWKESTTENVADFTATGYFYALALQKTLQVPIGLINCSWGGSCIEGWLPENILKGYSDIDLEITKNPQYKWRQPLVLYNAMLYPTRKYTIKGFIWYQGCANVNRYASYTERMVTMVKEWRRIWEQGELPFYYVEIAPFAYSKDCNGTKSAYLREAQFKAQALIPNSAMITTNDLVEPYEYSQIHPRKKREIGNRLAWHALAKTYGHKGIYPDSPSYREMEIDGKQIIVRFNHADRGLSPWEEIKGFEIAGENKKFYPAEAQLGKKDDEIIVSSPKVKKPVAVRYCFKNFQIGNVVNHRDQPLIPFRTDNW
ncbi:MAG: sialate O-acetylesterase [Parabacteroides sp.]|nr:sialate O-acetylesterase [Parabacteroides sp.]